MTESVNSKLHKITQEIKFTCQRIGRDPNLVKIIGASKEQSVEKILEAYNAGLKCFGENKVQELLLKKDQLPPDIEWHFIGQLQRNKVSKIAPFIGCIQSLDSEELAIEIEKRAKDYNRALNCLIQININKEETKGGIEPQALTDFYNKIKLKKGIKIRGLMTIPSPYEDLRASFKSLKALSKEIKISHIELSMGMSDDFIIAIEEGATMVRIGSALFGPRN